jgi:hypothetical protein
VRREFSNGLNAGLRFFRLFFFVISQALAGRDNARSALKGMIKNKNTRYVQGQHVATADRWRQEDIGVWLESTYNKSGQDRFVCAGKMPLTCVHIVRAIQLLIAADTENKAENPRNVPDKKHPSIRIKLTTRGRSLPRGSDVAGCHMHNPMSRD